MMRWPVWWGGGGRIRARGPSVHLSHSPQLHRNFAQSAETVCDTELSWLFFVVITLLWAVKGQRHFDASTGMRKEIRNPHPGTSLVVQWSRICLPMQPTQVWSLVREDPTYPRATKPVHHSYSAHTPESLCSPTRSHCNEKPAHRH